MIFVLACAAVATNQGCEVALSKKCRRFCHVLKDCKLLPSHYGIDVKNCEARCEQSSPPSRGKALDRVLDCTSEKAALDYPSEQSAGSSCESHVDPAHDDLCYDCSELRNCLEGMNPASTGVGRVSMSISVADESTDPGTCETKDDGMGGNKAGEPPGEDTSPSSCKTELEKGDRDELKDVATAELSTEAVGCFCERAQTQRFSRILIASDGTVHAEPSASCAALLPTLLRFESVVRSGFATPVLRRFVGSGDETACKVVRGEAAFVAAGEETSISLRWPSCAGQDCETDCSNGLDDDGDGRADCEDPVCAAVCEVVVEQFCQNELDDDRDGFADCEDSDCSADPVCQTVVDVDGGASGASIAEATQGE